ncbi:MAG TPA: cupin domain-containing protein [Burkholderiales bacterium]|nr:cupin domain-containing protein [Burkholderiales bacterium]
MKRSTKRREVLDRKVLQGLLLAAAPIAPEPKRAAAIKERFMDAVRSEDAARENYVTVRSDAGEWMDLVPQVQVKVLHSDGRYNSILLRMGPGASLPAHFHQDDEECVVLEGRVCIGDVGVSAGDYHLALSGSRHGELRSDTGALLFLRTTKQFRRASAPPEG